MTLKEYKHKRTLEESKEPKAVKKTSQKDLIFVVQKHAASHLHYDFRLECNGVLISWAIPKGPSLNPTIKRLAMKVEDHPFDYKDFEGTIPKGNYGAGTVMVWDEGTYTVPDAKNRKEAEKIVQKGIEKGHIDIEMQGEKLKGIFSLIHLKNSPQENSWLLIKKKDSFSTTNDVTKLDKSVKTSRTLDQITHGESAAPVKKRLKKMPHDISPMLATLIKEPFNNKEWLFEIKWDGFRALAYADEGKITLASRSQHSFNSKFPLIVEDLKKIPGQVILDGEIVILDAKGKSHFQLMQNYQTNTEGTLLYYVFDMLYKDGQDLRELPLIERKQQLKAFLDGLSLTRANYSDHIEEKGIPFFKAAKKNHLEGIVAKKISSTYQSKRSTDWLKIKTTQRQEVVIGGFTPPQGGRKYFGALLVGVYEKDKLIYAGRVGGGFNETSLKAVYEKLQPLIQTKSPFTNLSKGKSITWVKPKLLCEVAFSEWTSDNSMRHPVFQGLREDKPPRQVKKEVFKKPKI